MLTTKVYEVVTEDGFISYRGSKAGAEFAATLVKKPSVIREAKASRKLRNHVAANELIARGLYHI